MKIVEHFNAAILPAANQIERIDWSDVSRLQALRVLDLKDNRLTSMEGLLPPTIEELYLVSV